MPRGYPTPPETLVEARRLYECSDLTETRIAVLSGVSRSTLRRRAVAEGWLRPDGAKKPEAARQDVVASLRERIEREIVAAEAAMGQTAEKTIDGVERISRSLASLVKTLRELARYDEERAGRAGQADAAGDEDVADIDAFRAALADRLERLRGQRGQ
ncbi:hypothetical protein IHQ68_13435 [Chelatococcus sambhunathii]|uniref:Uncharacterized protein n=1 Tax=Chelatococcus sambhunathii TaxID=363953 RepID=A0ABU1DHM1_9HYPH|nr:hypothetical protein [Chelatococcus sambhunathii]MDR4307622.1 hypothetical protein [Chelatococcus sambhunathii]